MEALLAAPGVISRSRKSTLFWSVSDPSEQRATPSAAGVRPADGPAICSARLRTIRSSALATAAAGCLVTAVAVGSFAGSRLRRCGGGLFRGPRLGFDGSARHAPGGKLPGRAALASRAGLSRPEASTTSSPVARSRIRSLKRSEPSSSTWLAA